jgi:hypothetical protein
MPADCGMIISMSSGLRSTTLREVVGRSFILTYNEQVDKLEVALREEGLRPDIIRASYTPDEMQYSRNTRTFMNHYEAWQRAAAKNDYTLICESDFVPCVDLGSFHTFWPLENPLAWGYLYQGSPRLLALIGNEPFLRGHAAPLVSYVINQNVAKILIRFYEHELTIYSPTDYWTFDSHLQWFAMWQGAEAYIPLRQYGEHGGVPNREHALRGQLSRGGVHRADNLAKQLRFLPDYAEGSHKKFLMERCKARALGWARLFTGRWVSRTDVYQISPMTMVRMYVIGASRLAGF